MVPDLVDVTLGLVLEADSHEFHTGRARLTSDCWRYDELVVEGWRVLRFTWEQVMLQQAWVRSVLSEQWLADRRTHKLHLIVVTSGVTVGRAEPLWV